MVSRVLRSRLSKYLRNSELDSEAVEQGVFESVEELMSWYEEDEERLDELISCYKQERWGHRFVDSYGAIPVATEKKLQRHGRGIDRKAAVAWPWQISDDPWMAACAFCGIPLGVHEMTEDHIVAKNHGGSNEIVNLVPSCDECNRTKSGRSAEEFLFSMGYERSEIGAAVDSWQDESRREVPIHLNLRMSDHERAELGIMSPVASEDAR